MKQSPMAKIHTKGPPRQRLHPGMLSAQDRATAHYGAVTGLKVTEYGMHLLSAGTGLFKLELEMHVQISSSFIKLWSKSSGVIILYVGGFGDIFV